MKTITYTTIDRTGWPSGEWDNEPDKVQWQDEATGLPCLAVRNRHAGNWCGYVGVTQSHPAFMKEYDSVRVGDDEWPEVHGGLTYADLCQPENHESRGICHVPDPDEPDHVWWLGFDCAHFRDASPRDYMLERDLGGIWSVEPDQTYRRLAYVQAECRSLARQLAEST